MLYNPKWKPEVKDLEYDGISLRAFITWLETKDPNEKYAYSNPWTCATAQYKRCLGFQGKDVLVDIGHDEGSMWLNNIVQNDYMCSTFGRALEIARETLEKLK